MLKIKSFVSKQIFDIKTYGLRRLIGKFFTLVKILFRIPIYLIAFVPCIIIRLISPWILIRINRFPCANFGDFVEFPSLYHCKKELKLDLPKKKYLDFVYIDTNDKIHNKQLAKMWRRKFNFLSGYLLEPIDRVNKFMPGWKVHEIDVLSRRRSRDVNNLSERHQPLHFTNEEEIYGKEMLNKFGLTEGDKFVCLAIRDSGYQKKKISPQYRDWSYHDYRNQDVSNYLLAAEELAERGYYIKIVMPKDMSIERKSLLRMYGAELIEVDAGDFDEAIRLKDELVENHGYYPLNQFTNKLNIECHYKTTFKELLSHSLKIGKYISAFIVGTGTGGTIMGIQKGFSEFDTRVKMIAVEPAESPVMSGGEKGPHGIQGIGDGSKFLVDLNKIDEVITISTKEAEERTKQLALEHGLLVGISSGANILASERWIKTNNPSGIVFTILCDRGERYCSILDSK